ncbi:hypothetical protein [Chitinivibrio alkaliphilus]|uniref:Uncharacterized protein n=1 Tax=Chitinivibrio alkaliphilus ACht1 TaxID=1313304 RepID=U7DCF2_9BACT|nr:hypothetical protein [Chitinivibrio alkaliphilus]ERP39253.1 hypothetical protein CALK_0044 [Chitinivibrio alkaliphilus ACht1]
MRSYVQTVVVVLLFLLYTGCLFSSDDSSDSADEQVYTGTIDLTSYAQEDNKTPHASVLATAKEFLYVGMQRLDGWDVVAPSLFLIIDRLSGEVVEEIDLTYGNVSSMEVVGTTAYVVNPGSFMMDGDGGVERICLRESTVHTVFDSDDFDPVEAVHVGGDSLLVATQNTDWQDPAYSLYLIDGSAENTVLDTLLYQEAGTIDALAYLSGKDVFYVSAANALMRYTSFPEMNGESIETTLPVRSMVAYEDKLLVIESDYESGLYGFVEGSSYTKMLEIYQDARAVVCDGTAYILEQLGRDNIIRLTEDFSIDYQRNMGSDLNIYDVAISSGGTGYFLSYQKGRIVPFHAESGEPL